jgi:hypothetical protein
MDDRKEAQEAIETVLGLIIDEWYGRVSSYYVTAERLAEEGSPDQEEELKKFHDENGHRIKFSKDELDFTYGLRSFWLDDDLLIEISANNKVENFDIDEFQVRLKDHYVQAGKHLLPTPYELKSRSYDQVFELDSNFEEAFSVEVREGKADIMRLSFRLNPQLLPKLASKPVASKTLVENFCVTPFRNVYASVYRNS